LRDNTAQLIKMLIRLGFSITSLQFIAAGSAALAFSEGTLYLLVDIFSVDKMIGVMIAAESSLLFNFILNDNWTFRSMRRNSGGLVGRLAKFHISRISSLVLAVLLFAAFTELLSIHYLLANFLAVLIAFLVNFVTSFLWVWKAHLAVIADREGKRGLGGH